MSSPSRIADRFADLHRKNADQTIFAWGKSQTTADASTATSTSVYSDAMTWNWDELPDGVYVVSVECSLLMSSSTASQVSIRSQCNGVDGTAHNRAVTADLENLLRNFQGYTEVVADGGVGITIKVQFKVGGSGSGTATSTNPCCTAAAIKVG